MSITKSDRKSERRFFNSLGFLISVLTALFALLFVFAPRYEKRINLIAKDRVPAQVDGTSRRQKLRDRSGRQVALQSDDVQAGAAETNEMVRPTGPSGSTSTAPSSAEDLAEKVSRAVELIDGGNAKEAQSILEDVLAQDPKNEQALVELGMIHLIDYHSAGAALPYLEDALKVNASNKIVLSELVGVYEELGQSEQGLLFLTQVHDGNPDNGAVSYAMAQMMLSQGRDGDAIPYLESAVSAGDEDAEVAMPDLAEAYSSAGFPEKSLATYKKAIDQERLRMQTGDEKNNSDDGYADDRLTSLEMDYARELIRQGRFDDADETLKRISSRMPGDEGVSALVSQLNRKRGAG